MFEPDIKQRSLIDDETFGILDMTQVLSTSEENFSSLGFKNYVETVGVYKLKEDVIIPEFKTLGSACADICANFSGFSAVKAVNERNEKFEISVKSSYEIMIPPKCKAMVPTNLIFDIPENYKLLIYSRSGSSFKKSQSLANGVGVVDSDYVEPVFVLIFNNSEVDIVVSQHERIAQVELVPVLHTQFVELEKPPSQKTNREGGFGSTG